MHCPVVRSRLKDRELSFALVEIGLNLLHRCVGFHPADRGCGLRLPDILVGLSLDVDVERLVVATLLDKPQLTDDEAKALDFCLLLRESPWWYSFD